MNLKLTPLIVLATLVISCNDEEPTPQLDIPSSYESSSYDANVVSERAVINELAQLTTALNEAESNAQSTAVADIEYPANLSAVTLSSYQTLTSVWLSELVKAANDDDSFQNPGIGMPASGEEGGLLGGRLLDEYGLELEQMIEKGAFGAALYNHALTIINGDLIDASTIDKLVEIHGTSPAFDPNETTAAAAYSKRRSNHVTQEGFFYDIRNSLITARAAIEAGRSFDALRDQAIADYLIAWEKSNFATVIFYCNATKVLLQSASGDEKILGDAIHAYAEGVGFAHGFKGLANKQITDAQIDLILELLLAPDGEIAQSYQFLNDATLLSNFDQIISDIQRIYGFTDEEIASFYVNDPT
ncbi:MAG: hypothetical protein ACI83W_001310 [Marinoscillum sp.]|jgi:hypothetical protein